MSCNPETLCDPVDASIKVLVVGRGTPDVVGYVLPSMAVYAGDLTALVKCGAVDDGGGEELGGATIVDNTNNTTTISGTDINGVATTDTVINNLLVNDGGIGVSRDIDPDADILLHDANVSPMDFPSCDTVPDANDLVMKNPDDGKLWVQNAGVKTVFGGTRTVPVQDLNGLAVQTPIILDPGNCRTFPAHPDQVMQYTYFPLWWTLTYILQPGWVVRVDSQIQLDGGVWGTSQALRIDTRNNTMFETEDWAMTDEVGVITVLKCSPRDVCVRVRITVEVIGDPGVNTVRPRGSRIVGIGGTLV